MRWFVMLVDPVGGGITDVIMKRYEALPRRRGWEFVWQQFHNAAVLTAWDDPWGDALAARDGEWIAIGSARLDNRPEVERWSGRDPQDCASLSDLSLVLQTVAAHGTKRIPAILGDFGFIAWNGTTRQAIAAVDAFAVKPLYYAEPNGLLGISSRAEALVLEERYNVEYLVSLLALDGSPRNLTVYAGIRPVPPASIALLERGRLSLTKYWSATEFQADLTLSASEPEAIARCRQLFAESVRLRMGSDGKTWAQLSGGLDSSTVVSVAQWLARSGSVAHGLAGTLTYVDREGTAADERQYSDAVVGHWGVHNEVVVEPPLWHDDNNAPPRTDQPVLDLPFYPRDYVLRDTVRRSGGRVLLTGWGGDELFAANMFFFADWIAQGQMWRAIRTMANRAAIGRVSFWELAAKNALLPLLPHAAQRQFVRDGIGVQPWLQRTALRRYGLTARSPMAAEYAGPLGKKFWYARVTRMARLGNLPNRGVLSEVLEVRHPLLFRPLVEFALRLPPELNARPHQHRWIVREAMRGILPEKVRTRIGKQGSGGISGNSFIMQWKRLMPLLDQPILAELDVIDASTLRTAFEATLRQSRPADDRHAEVSSVLAVEAWLQMRSGRWPRGGHQRSSQSQTQLHQPSS